MDSLKEVESMICEEEARFLLEPESQQSYSKLVTTPIKNDGIINVEGFHQPAHSLALFSALALAVDTNATGASSFGMYSSMNCNCSAAQNFSSANKSSTSFFVFTWYVEYVPG